MRLHGASSVSDHGEFVYARYRRIDASTGSGNLLDTLDALIDEWAIDIVLPAHDSVIPLLAEAGERLHAALAPALAEIEAAIESTGDHAGAPRGQLRLAVSSIAERFLAGPLLAGFAAAHPAVQLDVTVTDEEFDIVAEGFDAGVRLGEVIEQDMIAVPVSAEQRQIVVAAPAYLARAGAPAHPRELAGFRCIGWRAAPQKAPYRWEFTEDGRDFTVAVAPEITTNDMALMIKLALAGGGLTFGLEETFRPYIARGELVPLLEPYCPPFAGFYLYYPSRRNLAPKLRALIDHLRYGTG
ncbi:MAG: LysR family transcriptional regulator [Starkeya sp.]|nr:LysR family transcriptional regulator [Starkeya sp.]